MTTCDVMKEAVYGVVLTGSKKEVEMFDKTLQELKRLAFVDEKMGANDFVQECFQIGYNEFLKQLAWYEDDFSYH